MNSIAFKLVRGGVFAVTALVLVLCGGSIYFAHEFLDASAWVKHTTEVMGEIRATRVPLSFTVAPDPRQPLPVRIPDVLDHASRIADLTLDNPTQQNNIQEFRALLSRPGQQNALDFPTVRAAYLILDRMQAEEYRLLALRTERQSAASLHTAIQVAVLCLSLLALVLFTALAARREFLRRERAENTLLREKLDLTRHGRELALVSAGSELIHAAAGEPQIEQAVAQIMRDLLPGSDGYFGLISPSKDIVEVCASWGVTAAPVTFSPADCLALQLGRLIHGAESLVQITCAHAYDPGRDHLCIPIRSGDGHLGLLHVQSSEQLSRKTVESVSLFAGTVALGLNNLRMREALRSQTVRDSLTGLFNRRYFDETLLRELAAARRVQSPVSVLMIDLDHFKRTNDTYGHAAGDEALRTLARLLRSTFRESDVVCRYGGEEFAVILPHADVHGAYGRAESFRKLVALTELGDASRSLGPISTSIGMASSPDYDSANTLLKAADSALYFAKSKGRNTTCVSTARRHHDVPDDCICRTAPATDTSLLNPPAWPTTPRAYQAPSAAPDQPPRIPSHPTR